MSFKKNLTSSKEANISDWYTEVISKGDLIHYSNIKGFMSFLPNGWKIWQQIRQELTREFEKRGILELCLPSLISHNDFLLEKKHLEGFAPELFLVTKTSNENEKYVLKPTSEISFCNLWRETLRNYRQLPIKHNQWTSVFRVEKNTRPFLRNSEFFWHEIHSCFETEEQSNDFALNIWNLYQDFIKNVLCIPLVAGEKTEVEKFAGAKTTYTVETIMPDGQALQSATSHNLSQNFSKAFDIKYQTKNNDYQHVYTMSAGISTRIIGAIIMTHGDDDGLVFPTTVAPYHISLNCIFDNTNEELLSKLNELNEKLSKKYRVHLDLSKDSTGEKIKNSQQRGDCCILMMGPNDLKKNEIVFMDRISKQKQFISLDNLDKIIEDLFGSFDKKLYEKAQAVFETKVDTAKTFDEFKEKIESGKFVKVYYCDEEQYEKEIKEKTKASSRCIIKRLDDKTNEKCFISNKQAKVEIYFARSY
ncbi:proline--tRNA ligase [Mycoplasma bradburyae]|uniref:Proline--tRNA ligase n=1 Tax=Mycoplasma bradburyae TaxID=2963128 RepID=A0AAW6HR72_9MOLU|nr:proline--tRNA ligase [Mycoplasma bradburyae]MDC4163513.1 proline--tRNA ligase [Mycoplasma bradburyae]MDC4183560.1 proline--tRNA ligase [Mycoplasma bradburyae]MDC4184298.1 proline--tRNA ligase [Mycoplasma bradburyae]UTS71042.1 proline--tRNA ligase [Mycoplasma bradburyae]